MNNDLNVEILSENLNVQITLSGVTEFLQLIGAPDHYEEGKYLKATSNGLVWDVPQGGGNMLKRDYDANNDGIVDHAEIANQIDGGSFL